MTEETNVENVGAEGNANPPVSAGAVADASQLSELVKQAIAAELKPIKGEISGLYSRQDKDRSVLGEFMDEFKKQKAKGLSDGEAEAAAQTTLKSREKEAERDALFAKLAEKLLNEPSTQATGSSASGTFDVAQAVEDLQVRQLDANDPDFIALIKSGLSKEKYNEYIANKTRPSKPASVGGIAQPPGTGVPKSSPDALVAEYQSKMLSARGNKGLATAIKEEYRQKGVPVDQVYFGV